MDASMTERWEIDLSPGTLISPLTLPPGLQINVVTNSSRSRNRVPTLRG
jgi:hypothetical protein